MVYSSVEGPADSDNKTIVFLVRTKDGIHYEDVAKIDVPGSYKTMLLKGGLDGRFEQIVVLPSGGDTSYPGFLVVGDELFYNGNSLTNNLIEDRPLVFKRATEDQIKKYQDEADAWYGGADGSEHTITGVGEGWTWAGEIAATAVDR